MTNHCVQVDPDELERARRRHKRKAKKDLSLPQRLASNALAFVIEHDMPVWVARVVLGMASGIERQTAGVKKRDDK